MRSFAHRLSIKREIRRKVFILMGLPFSI